MDNTISRRSFLKTGSAALGAVAVSSTAGLGTAFADKSGASSVFFTKDISAKGLLEIYSQVSKEHKLAGKVAVKLHSGEPGGHHYPNPVIVKELVQSLNGTIVECNTAYPGKRFKTADHKQAMQDHGFTAIAPVDIMDENGSISLPCPKGIHISENFVGANYDSFLILSHFKGHAMGGFGGALKNMSIGIASGEGKMWIHTAGSTRSLDNFAQCFETDHDSFLESMAEAAGSIINKMGKNNLIYVNLMNNLSIDCDCDNNPAPPEMQDVGILASLDPVALDKACIDLVYTADKTESASLRKRIESLNGTHTIDHAEKLGLGSQKYQLIRI